MKKHLRSIALLLLVCMTGNLPGWAQHPINSQEFPKKILHTGTKLFSPSVSPNAVQLAEQLDLLPLLLEIEATEQKLEAMDEHDPDSLTVRVQLLSLRDKARTIIQKANLEVDYILALLVEEENVNSELLDAFLDKNDKVITRANALGFGINSLLWPVSAAFSLVDDLLVSGIVGIPAGVVPIMTSGYALLRVRGGHYSAPADPNLLSKLFERPVAPEMEYPKSVWTFLNTVPAEGSNGKTRLEHILAHWIMDKNIPDFTDKHAKKQIDIITGSIQQKKTLTLAILRHRQVMFKQLAGEISKMNRLLLELMMVLEGSKHIMPVSLPQ